MSAYYFENATLREKNKLPVPGLRTIWVVDLEHYPDKEIEQFFRSVIKANGWRAADRIVAYPDRKTSLLFVFENGSLFMHDQEEETFSDESEEEESFDFYNENVVTEEETFLVDFSPHWIDTDPEQSDEEEEFLSPATRKAIERLVHERVAAEIQEIRQNITKEIFASLRDRLL